MTTTTFSMIFLGNFGDLDTVEGNSAVENEAALINSYYDAADPAYSHITTVTADDANSDGVIQGDGFGAGESMSYDLGSGTVNTVLDFAATVNVTITFTASSGEPDYVGLGGIIQTAEGDLFLVMIDDDFGLGANALDNAPVQSINVTSVSGSGQNQNATASDDQEFVTCFVSGSKIQTGRGPVAVENICVGDMVLTAGNGLMPVRWVAKTHVSAGQMARNPKLRPVRISAGALGNNLPLRDLRVSRQHRMLASSAIASRMFGADEILVHAIKLTALPGIFVEETMPSFDYFHVLLDTHEVIFSEGAPTESLHLGPMSLKAMPHETRQELGLLLPELAVPMRHASAALKSLTNVKQKRFVERCKKNRKAILEMQQPNVATRRSKSTVTGKATAPWARPALCVGYMLGK
ncbi:Hint domain-containing protein [uncultured Litoreibacter sp.]|uniref:Hint domain-containing protein n=1 Tax=uncultured Litoreibacter sp. TaxID=1392394 RepID=UPI00261D5326|nr:Hint domain-containing protein [uncultured Litoreibacter sp.]